MAPETNGNGERMNREANIIIGRLALIGLGVAGSIIGAVALVWGVWLTSSLMDLNTRMAVVEAGRPSQVAKATPVPTRNGGMVREAAAAERTPK